MIDTATYINHSSWKSFSAFFFFHIVLATKLRTWTYYYVELYNKQVYFVFKIWNSNR